MRILAGLEARTAGRVEVAGQPVEEPLDQVGIVFQDHLLLDWRTALQNVMLQAEFRGIDHRAALSTARELLRSVGLAGFEDKHPWELSGGMRQRVSVCRALLHDPPLLFMDEPFGALDALTREQMRIDLEKLWLGTGKTVIFITHSISEAILLSDRVLVFSARPGTILDNVEVQLERPRSVKASETAAFQRYNEQILEAFHQSGVLRY
jgi:NitT/TauT family transport system ATP-binding protein